MMAFLLHSIKIVIEMIYVLVKTRKESWTSQQSNIGTSFIFPGRKVSDLSSDVQGYSLQRQLSSMEADSNFDPLIKQQVEWNVRQVIVSIK